MYIYMCWIYTVDVFNRLMNEENNKCLCVSYALTEPNFPTHIVLPVIF